MNRTIERIVSGDKQYSTWLGHPFGGFVRIDRGLRHGISARLAESPIKPGQAMKNPSGSEILSFRLSAIRRKLFPLDTEGLAIDIATGCGGKPASAPSATKKTACDQSIH